MCLCSITIPNKVTNFHPRYDRLFNTVPCGHCAECLQNKRDDWYVRAYYEWLDCIKKGGFALFVTFTYSNDWIPQLLIDYQSCNCFDKRDLQKYLDALRKVIKRKYETDAPFRYIVTSEYGGKTHRPHYHAILFFQHHFNENWIRYQIRRLWKYGFIKYGRENRGLITNYRGIRYVVKYITKDSLFRPISEKLKSCLPEETYKYYLSRCSPFHIQSNHLGYCTRKYVAKDLIEKGTIPVPSKNGLILVHMPLYLTRKYYYEYNKELQRYTPTAEGVAVLSARASKITERLAKSQSEFINNVETYLSEDILNFISLYTSLNPDKDYITRKFDEVKTNFKDYIYYIQYERFYMYVQDSFPEPLVHNSSAPYHDKYYRQYIHGKNGINEFYYSNSRFSSQGYDKKIRKECEQYLYNDLSENTLFEECCLYTEWLQKAYNQTKQEKDDKNEKVINQLKKLKEIYETSI